MMKKRGVVLLSLVVLSFLMMSWSVYALPPPLDSIFNVANEIVSLKFLGIQGQTAVMSFLRLMVGILVFALFFEGARLLPFQRNTRLAIAFVLATLSVLLIPGQVLVGISAAYSTLAALILVGVPVAGGFYLVYRMPSATRGEIAMKLVLLFILLLILWALKAWVTGSANKAIFGF
ncbi:hypothetical protein HYX13_03900 [Candidatus Woesearchaeota archaeon]|nr:hypothetical protein [Candidatus Woesearchaeota archaeon]